MSTLPSDPVRGAAGSLSMELLLTHGNPSADTLLTQPVQDDGIAPFSVVIPAYNEAQCVEEVLDELLDAVIPLGIPCELIVVDDGSSDDTFERAQTRASRGVRTLRHSANRGYGAALKTGTINATHDWIVITDADGTYPSMHIKELLSARSEAVMVVGSRTGKHVRVPILRRAPKWALRRLASYLIMTPIPDLNSGLRVMRKDLIQRFFHILPNQFSFTTTITLAAVSAGYPVQFLPIDYRSRKGKSKIRPIADTIGFAVLVIRTVMFFDPLRVFLPIAAVFVGASVVVGAGSYLLFGRLMDVTTVLLFVTGIHMVAIGMLADLVNRKSRP